jgi:GR25 family glycosyltransferase involved in LPS biosynthesis
MHVFYINLDRDADRRHFFESNFKENNKHDWPCTRVSAIDKRTVADGPYAATMSKGAVGLSMTHRRTVQDSIKVEGHVMIAEDDILFGASTQDLLLRCIANVDPKKWDIMFTDICIPRVVDMLHMSVLRRDAGANHTTIDLRNVTFAGTTGLVINKDSKNKYLRLLHDRALFSMPIDMLIADYTRKGLLNSVCTFPFVTSLSKYADSSEIQVGDVTVENQLWNAFRRATWVENRPDEVAASLDSMPAGLADPGSLVVARIVSSLLINESLKKKRVPKRGP